MKILLLFAFSALFICATAQNLEKTPAQERDSILINMAEQATKKYAPDYYRKYGTPIIRKVVTQKEMEKLDYGSRYGRVAYIVTLPYDTNKEYFPAGYSAEVFIWADTGKLYFIVSGNGIGMAFKETQTRTVEENFEVIPYVKHERPGPYDFMKKK